MTFAGMVNLTTIPHLHLHCGCKNANANEGWVGLLSLNPLLINAARMWAIPKSTLYLINEREIKCVSLNGRQGCDHFKTSTLQAFCIWLDSRHCGKNGSLFKARTSKRKHSLAAHAGKLAHWPDTDKCSRNVSNIPMPRGSFDSLSTSFIIKLRRQTKEDFLTFLICLQIQ